MQQDETYGFPFLMICFFHGEGCGFADESTDTCLETAVELGYVLDHNSDEVDGLIAPSEVRPPAIRQSRSVLAYVEVCC